MTVVATEASSVELVTIPNITLLTVGDWNASTGPVTFTEQHLKAAIAALDDPAVKAPRLRIGHSLPSIAPEESAGGFEEQPTFGRFVNLRLANNGTSIVADAAGVPAWLAEILPAAYPSRSVEAYFNITTAAGRTHEMVITAVALLGVSMPACETLEDLRLAFGAETPDGVELQFTGERVAASQGDPMPKRVSASVTYSDVRTSFYNDFATQDAGRYWWWICDFIMSPTTVIADDDEGGLWSVPYTLSGDTVTWDEPVEVRIQYVETGSGQVAASRPTVAHRGEYIAGGATLAAAPDTPLFTAAASRPIDRVRAATVTNERSDVDISTLREQLELPETATDDEVIAAAAEKLANPPAVEEPAVEVKPEAVAASQGTVVAPDALAALQEDARLGREAREQQISAERAAIVDERVHVGAITTATRDAHLAELSRGGDIEKAHRTYLAGLATGVVPVGEKAQAPSDTTANTAQLAVGLAAAGITPKER